MRYLRHILHTLLAAAAIGLSAASGVSCVGGADDGSVGSAQNSSPLPTPDTSALTEGLRLFEEAEYDLAREQLTVSARSADTYIRAESFLYLNALEMELGNYDAARAHLDRYHVETRRLLLGAADSSRRMEEQAARLRKKHDLFAGGMMILAVMIVGAALFFVRRGRPRQREDPQAVAAATEAASGCDISDWQHYTADAETFKRTAVWDEILSLASQKPGRDARVLSSARQQVLDGELAERFPDFAERLRAEYPALTAGDVKLCCLALLPLSNFARALCFGSIESNIIKQRKHTIKKKLCTDARGRALFEFIFTVRDEI